MSGGVDSSVVAALLKSQGYDVVGLTMQLYDHGAATAKGKTCCAGQDIYDARRVSDMIGIPHYVVDYETTFKADVMDRFADGYIHGETPVPCVLCNQTVKFRDLLKAAKDLGADALATGHYVQRIAQDGGVAMFQAIDPDRDQSYFLFATTRAQLDFVRFPLGGMTKSEARDLGVKFGLHVAAKPDSQDICFVPEGRYTSIVEKLRPDAARPGEIVDASGAVLGRHDGVMHFTVGQRKGLGLSGNGEPLFVLSLDAARARVVVGPRAALAAAKMTLREMNWLITPDAPFDCEVKVRSTRPPVAARVTPLFDETGEYGAQVELLGQEEAVAPGQACVFYSRGRVLGGGWIAAVERASAPTPRLEAMVS